MMRADELRPELLGRTIEFTDRGTTIKGPLLAMEVRQEALRTHQLYDDPMWRATPIELQVGEWTGTVLPSTRVQVQGERVY